MFYTYHASPPRPVRSISSNAAAREARSSVQELEHEVERLLMICEGLWEVLKEKHGYTDDELMRRVALIDMRDGKLDGRVAKAEPLNCPKCQRVMNKRHVRCIYCGVEVVQNPFAR